MEKRDSSLDFMRFLGVLIIMLAHSDPPGWLFQLRNFGTPLLIVASGATFSVIYRSRPFHSEAFLKKRLRRLILPTWAFLTFFFCFWWIAAEALGENYPWDLKTIVETFTFYDGIGFVWIFKVYVILAFLTPLAFSFNRRIKSKSLYFTILLLAYGLYEVLLRLSQPHIPAQIEPFMHMVIFVIAPYALLYLYGFKIVELTPKQILLACVVPFVIFVVMAIFQSMEKGHFVGTQTAKYPPTLYYLSYAFVALNISYLFCRTAFSRVHSPAVVWLSTHALWIYLWHIFAYFVWEFTLGSAEGYLPLVIAKMAFLLGFGIAATYAQNNLLGRLQPQLPKAERPQRAD